MLTFERKYSICFTINQHLTILKKLLHWLGPFCLVFTVFACQEGQESAIILSEKGEKLAQLHCVSCHSYPAPDLLDKKTWDQYILPRMGSMMGILPVDSLGPDFIEPAAQVAAFKNPLLFRTEASLTMEEWQAIRQFYTTLAPKKPIAIEKDTILQTLPQFKPRFPSYNFSPPSTTLVNIEENQLVVGDANSKRIYFFDQNLNLKSAANTVEGAVWMNALEDGYVVTCMGSFSPTDQPTGLALFLPKQQNQKPIRLIQGLKRAVHADFGDLDGDGIADFAISEFAKWTGTLSWWKNDGKGGFERNVLKNMPGAIKSYIVDLNKDSLADVIALFGQGDEGISAFYNQGNGKFKEERLLRFPPSYGSSYFNFFDYNGDEHPDIIYTNGDNADYPPINKAYNGIRIFQNDGNNQFQEVWFYPLQGAYNAIPADFDQDGDLDVAAISFFPDYVNRPAASFLYLENQGDMNFKAHTFPEYDSGRWIVMDSGDLDADGDLDLVLGALTFEVIPEMGLVEKWVAAGIPFVVLENQLK